MKRSISHHPKPNKHKFFFKILREIDTKNNEIVPLIPFQEECWGKEGLEKLLASSRRSLTLEEKGRLRSLVQFNIPKEIRKNYWLIASGARIEMKNNPGYYKNITENFPDYIISGYESQIKLDLERTFPLEPYFQSQTTLSQMNNILQAYARRNSTIGYCQGFNYIVGRILEVMRNEEEAFWVFTQLIEGFLPVEYYSELVGIMTDCSILLQIVKDVLPDIYNHLHTFGFELSLNNILYNWLVSIFVQNMKKEVWMPIWDILFIDGNIVVFKAAIFLLSLAKDLILKQTSMIDINQFFEEEFKNFYDERLIDYVINKPFYYTLAQINELRKIQMPKVETNIRQTSDFKKNRYKETMICNLDWPVCLTSLATINIEHVSVLKRLINPVITKDFYSVDNDVYSIVKSKEKMNEMIEKRSKCEEDTSLKRKIAVFENLLIERHQHNCSSKKSTINEMESEKRNNSIRSFFNGFGPSSKDTLLFEDRRSLFCSSIIAEVEKSLSGDWEMSKEKDEEDEKEKERISNKMNSSDEMIDIKSSHSTSSKESPKDEIIRITSKKTK